LKLIKTLFEPLNWITTLCFSPDGSKLVAAVNGNDIKIWDTKSFKQLFCTSKDSSLSFNGPSMVAAIRFNQDGSMLTYAYNNSLYIYNVKGKHVSHLKTIELYNKLSKKQEKMLGDDAYDAMVFQITDICFRPDEAEIAVAGHGDGLKILDAESLEEKEFYITPQHFIFPRLRYSPDSNHLWLLADGQLFVFITNNYFCDFRSLHVSNPNSFTGSFHSKNNSFLSQSIDQIENNPANLYEWFIPDLELGNVYEAADHSHMNHFTYQLTDIQVSPDASLVASAAFYASLNIWTGSGELLVNKVFNSSGNASLTLLS